MDELVLFYPQGHEAHAERGHPERPERVEAIRAALRTAGIWDQSSHITPSELPEEVLFAIHDPVYIERLQAASRSGQRFDADTYVTRSSWDLAVQSAGGAIAVARAVWDGVARRGFALTRPPGHHATSNRAMGFCLLNNIALAAEDLIQQHGAGRLAIIDVDLHHGNGTQDIFYARGDVFYVSTHQFPLYPGTGRIEETGAGPGEWATLNLPLPPFSGDSAMDAANESLILPALDRISPEMVLVSVGFDTHWKDPLGHLIWTVGGYGEVIRSFVRWADRNCQGRIALFLEGGYDLEAGGACAAAATAALLGDEFDDPIGPSPWPEKQAWRMNLETAAKHWGFE